MPPRSLPPWSLGGVCEAASLKVPERVEVVYDVNLLVASQSDTLTLLLRLVRWRFGFWKARSRRQVGWFSSLERSALEDDSDRGLRTPGLNADHRAQGQPLSREEAGFARGGVSDGSPGRFSTENRQEFWPRQGKELQFVLRQKALGLAGQ